MIGTDPQALLDVVTGFGRLLEGVLALDHPLDGVEVGIVVLQCRGEFAGGLVVLLERFQGLAQEEVAVGKLRQTVHQLACRVDRLREIALGHVEPELVDQAVGFVGVEFSQPLDHGGGFVPVRLRGRGGSIKAKGQYFQIVGIGLHRLVEVFIGFVKVLLTFVALVLALGV